MKDFSETLSNLAAELRTRNEINANFIGVLEKIIESKDEEAAAVRKETADIRDRSFKLNLFSLLIIAVLAGVRVAEILHIIG